MITVSARKLLLHPTEELKEILKGPFYLQFDDGVIETNAFETYYSSFGWDMLRNYPETPILCKHHLTHQLKDKLVGSDTHRLLFNAASWSVVDTYKDRDPDIVEKMAEAIYTATNLMQNAMVVGLEASAVSMDLLEYIEIMRHPEVEAVRKNLQPNSTSIDLLNRTISRVMHSDPSIAENTICLSVRAKLVREAQMLQCLGVRGFTKEINSDVFKHPIMRGFTEGMRKFHDALIESRSASMSLFYSTAPLKLAEYFARKLQLLCMAVERLHKGDCGSTRYLNFIIRDKEPSTNGRPGRKCDLDILEGKYYLDEESNQLKMLRKSDRHLIGKSLPMRFAFMGCKHADKNGICEVCYGGLAESVPKGSNIGHITSSASTQQSSQLILSTKHFLGSSVIELIEIDEAYRDFIKASSSGTEYMFQPGLEALQARFVVSSYAARGMTDIREAENVRRLGITHVSDIEAISIITTDEHGEIRTTPIDLNIARRNASMTYDMLEHIKQVGWDFDEKGNYIVPLQGWDFSKSAFTLPMRDHNMSDYAKLITGIIESSKEKHKKRQKNQTTPEQVFFELYDTLNSRLSVNAALVDVIILAAMVKSIEQKDYALPKGDDIGEIGVTALTIPNRSSGAAMAFEKHREALMNTDSFSPEGRTDHLMDVFICPQETVMHRRPDVFKSGRK